LALNAYERERVFYFSIILFMLFGLGFILIGLFFLALKCAKPANHLWELAPNLSVEKARFEVPHPERTIVLDTNR